MFEHLLKIRYIVVVVVLFAALHAVTFLVMGVQSAIVAYKHVLGLSSAESTARPGLEILHSLDLFIIAIVMVVLALGVAKLFLLDPGAKQHAELPAWLQIDRISQLKVLLWETILTFLLILGLSELTSALFGTPDWKVLLVPAALLLLALSLFFMKKE